MYQMLEGAEVEALEHWIILLLVAPCGAGFEETTKFAVGHIDRLDTRILSVMCAKFFFAYVSERWIEGRHALMKRSLANSPHASACHVGFWKVAPMVEEFLRLTPERMPNLTAACKRVRNLEIQ